MWQRIQTLYLAIATALIVSLFFCDKAQGVAFTRYWPYTVLLVIVSLLSILALTTWKFRIFQVRTTVLAAIFALALQAWLVVDFIVTGNDPLFRVPAIFPLVAVILFVLAARSIWADELMVRSASRLRPSRRGKH